MSFDLRVESRFKNAILWRLLNERFSELAKQRKVENDTPQGVIGIIEIATSVIGVERSALSRLLCLRDSPYYAKGYRNGAARPAARIIAEFFDLPVEHVFPIALYKLALPQLVVKEYDSSQILSLQEARRAGLDAYTPDFDLDMERIDQRKAIDNSFRSLNEQQSKVLTLRFGLDGEGEKTLSAIGTLLGVTQERIRQVEARAMRKLRAPALNLIASAG